MIGAIFDMDGLMFDTERLNLEGWRRAAAARGHVMTREMYCVHIGASRETTQRRMAEQFGPTFDFDAARADRLAWTRAQIEEHGTPLEPGLNELLSWLTEHGISTAIATSSDRDAVEFYLAHAPGLTHRFDAIATWEPGMEGKPAPDVFLKAAEMLGLPPVACVVLEDSHNGIRAAHAAGMRSIMVPDLLPATPDIAALATWVVPTLADAVPIFEGLIHG